MCRSADAPDRVKRQTSYSDAVRTRFRPAAPDAIWPRLLARRSIALVLVALLLVGCAGGAGGTPGTTTGTPDPSAIGLDAAVVGLCSATATLPDLEGARRAFVNRAHDPLHALAADPRLTRTAAARVLEGMGRVERDLDMSVGAAVLAEDLGALALVARAALTELGIDVASCAP